MHSIAALALAVLIALVPYSGLAVDEEDCGPEIGKPCLDPRVSDWERFSVSFGFEPDLVISLETVASLGCKRFGPDKRYWSCADAPAADSAFDGYVIVRGEDELCGVGAFAELGPDDTGAKSLALASRIGWRVSRVWGPPQVMEDGLFWSDDFLRKQEHFMFGMFHDRRVWKQVWILPEGSRWETVTLSIEGRTRNLGRYHGSVYLAMDHGRCNQAKENPVGD